MLIVQPTRPRRHPLRVVSSSHPAPRRRAGFVESDGYLTRCYAVEVITDRDWARLHPAERDPRAVRIAGLGWVALDQVCRAECDEIEDDRRAALALVD